MSFKNRLNQRGDTLVEVLLATVVLSMVLAGSFTISNRATRINQSALEKTEVSNLLRGQAELVKRGMDIGTPLTTTQGDITAVTPGFCDSAPTGPGFSIDTTESGLVYQPEPLLVGEFYYIWVERPPALSPTSETVDFTIRACWEGIGDSPAQETGLVLRVPRT